MYVHGYHKNTSNILHSNQRCWLVWSSSSLLCIFVIEPTDQPPRPGPEFLTLCFSLLTASESHSWLIAFFVLSSGLAGFRGHSTLCGIRAKIDKGRSSRHSGAVSKMPEIRSPFWPPIHQHTQRPTHIHPYIYIYIYIYISNPTPCPLPFVMRERWWNLYWKDPYLFSHSPYRALKLTFPRDIVGLTHNSTIDKEMGFGSMSQTVGVRTPVRFRPGTRLQ